MKLEQAKIDVMICTKDRPAELALLLQSLRTQTYQNFDIYIYEDRSTAKIEQNYYLVSLINRLKLEDHRVTVWRNEIRYGVTRLRQMMVDKIMKEGTGESILRLDDDNILNIDYISKLMQVINEGYDIACGVVPLLIYPEHKRKNEKVKPFIADVKLNEDGEITYFGDDLGYCYLDDEIIPTPHFRSMALIKKEVHKKIKYPENLGFCSFREEEFFSFKAIVKGYKIGVNTGAIAYHINSPAGGERTKEYYDNLQFNNKLLNDFTKQLVKDNGDFITKYKEKFKDGKIKN